MKPKHIFLYACLLITITCKANNVVLSNVTVINNVSNTGKIIQFDLTWENSWRTASTGNLDGVWVFFKFKDNDDKWYPLRFTDTDITMPVGATYDMGNNSGVTGVGIFIYRSQNGFGTATANGIQAGIQSYPGTFEVRGFAIEMVFVPQGSFYLGDGTDTLTTNSYQTGSPGNPYLVTGIGNTVTIGTTANNLHDNLITTGFNGTLANFPTGYAAFWIMKYEVSQGAYRDFLNTLTYAQQLNRFNLGSPPNSPTGTPLNTGAGFRQYLEIATPGNTAGNTTPAVVGCDANNNNVYDQSSDGEWVAAGFLHWGDAAAYLDWAGLRPMSEMEYEKACRGPLSAVENEYAWGTADLSNVIYSMASPGMATENITNSSSFLGNAIINNRFPTGPVRGGIFATTISTRVSAGASYYGIMELTGNLIEVCVQTNTAAGRSFIGKHGDGLLTSVGNANENYWPGVNGSTNLNASSGIYDGGAGVRSTAGITYKGGYFSNTTPSDCSVSFRFTFAAVVLDNNDQSYVQGFRGVRYAN